MPGYNSEGFKSLGSDMVQLLTQAFLDAVLYSHLAQMVYLTVGGVFGALILYWFLFSWFCRRWIQRQKARGEWLG